MKKSRTTDSKNWYRLDNAGKLYPSIASSRVSTVFRITVYLHRRVHVKKLDKAIAMTLKHLPMFNVRLKRGIFWYYFEQMDDIPTAEPERFFPCTAVQYKKEYAHPFKVLYHEDKIHFEISHAICDGAGALVFLKTLLHYYFYPSEPLPTIALNQLNAMSEDAFQTHYQKGIPVPEKLPHAYHFPFELIEKGTYHITIGTVSSQALLSRAKALGTTVTKLLLCLYFETILEFVDDEGDGTRPIILNMPVNLRGLFPAETVRNFFVSITPHIDPRLGTYERQELLRYIDAYFGQYLTPKYLKRYITRNVQNERFWHVRLIPLVVKDLIMPFIYSYYGESSYTSSLSNLGVIKLDEKYSRHIEKLAVLPPPSEGNLIKVTVVAHGDYTTICFGSLAVSKSVEKRFFRKLRGEGIDVAIETNY